MSIHLNKHFWCVGLLLAASLEPSGFAQRSFTWQEIRDKFEATNPTLRALEIGIDESKAQEITAYLRPNPDVAVATDGTQIAPYQREFGALLLVLKFQPPVAIYMNAGTNAN